MNLETKRKAFISSNLRPNVLGTRVSITNVNSWSEFYNNFSNFNLDLLKDLSLRRRFILRIFDFPEDIFAPQIKEMVHILRNVIM